MYRSETLAIVVSSTSMNVGTTTATATNQGLIAGRFTVAVPGEALFTRLFPQADEGRAMIPTCVCRSCSRAVCAGGERRGRLQGFRGGGHRGASREGTKGLEHFA